MDPAQALASPHGRPLVLPPRPTVAREPRAAGRTLATGVVPYPPGIPLLMPGENAGPADGPVLGYLNALQEFDRRFPGFEHDNHGVEVIDGTYHLYCVKQD